jgi:hypothetical protein
MIVGLGFAAFVLALLFLRWLFTSPHEGVRRLRTVVLWGLALFGLYAMLLELGWQATLGVIVTCAVIRWIYRGFKTP